ncbi:Piso0_005303 [Millerozyma farinosa CBS 7064]|uniref:Piso0_005303 protein n=1 Tax=Pichia sorbitophila (strain ATCC MYA-4447 / BCRC 22081 / CBS 7064 / NBRC 10061 / NRRL Y-12695) TaxID=559304 RepID=G8Y4R4_PICSO|nr:Piso0_005303 [Millerozyma farinosa CBS 7064]
MKIFSGLSFVFIYCLSTVLCYTVVDGSLKIGKDAIHFGEIETQEVKQLPIDQSTEKIEIQLKLKDDFTKAPNQLVVTVSDGKGLVVPYFPKFSIDNKEVKLTIPLKNIPANLKAQEKVHVSLVIGEPSSNVQLTKLLAELRPSGELTANYKRIERFGTKPEIHHVFGEDPKTVNPIVPIVFSAVGVFTLLILLISWKVTIGSDLLGLTSHIVKSNPLANVGFLLSLAGYEYVFIQYYLNASIFKTLLHGLILAIPSIYFGSRVLRTLYQYHKTGRA